MDEWHFIAERKIREAMDKGAFDHLEGTGEPLNLEENPFEDASLRMAPFVEEQWIRPGVD